MLPDSLFKGLKNSFLIARNSTLLQSGFILTVANVLTGLLGYVYQVAMGRMLTPAEFALFSAIMALSAVFSSPLGALFMVASRQVSTFRVQNRLFEIRQFYWKLNRLVFAGCVVGLMALYFAKGSLQAYLKSSQELNIWAGGVLVVFSAFMLLNNAFYQGMQRFGWLGGNAVLGVLLKIILSVLLISFGFGVVGALGGAVLSAMLICLLGMVLHAAWLTSDGKSVEVSHTQIQWRSIVPVLIATISFAAMTQLDMVLVNRFFPASEAGIYAAASVLGKAVLYLPGGLVMALFPLVAENHANQQESAHIMIQAVAVTAGVCGMVAVGYWLVGDWLILLLYGPSYQEAGALLRLYGIAILPMTLVMVAEHFLIAKGRVLFAWLFLAMAPVQIFAIYLWHSQLWMVVAIMGGCGAIMALVGYAMMWLDFRSV